MTASPSHRRPPGPGPVDVIVVAYLDYPGLGRCLASLFSQGEPGLGQVVVVDNGPAPTPRPVTARFPKVVWLHPGGNIGFAGAVNLALERCQAPYLCLLNPDSCLQGPFLARAAEWLQAHPDVAALAPRVVDPDGREQGAARRFPSLSTALFGRSSLLTRWFPNNPLTARNVILGARSPVEVEWVSGACMVVRRQAVEEVGGMDPRFFIYWEDCDWCTRFRRAGWRVIYHPGLGPVVHEVGRSSGRRRLFSLYHFHRSAVLLYAKYDTSPLKGATLLAGLGAAARLGLLALTLPLRRR